MSVLHRLLGVLLGCYVVHALATGRIHLVTRGPTLRYDRDEEGSSYWFVIGVYALLCVGLAVGF
jgi:succinate dehydrogenase/fumarate reductase cytochrome b subunit